MPKHVVPTSSTKHSKASTAKPKSPCQADNSLLTSVLNQNTKVVIQCMHLLNTITSTTPEEYAAAYHPHF